MEQGSVLLLAAVTHLSSEVQGENPHGLKTNKNFLFPGLQLLSVRCAAAFTVGFSITFSLIDYYRWAGRGTLKDAKNISRCLVPGGSTFFTP